MKSAEKVDKTTNVDKEIGSKGPINSKRREGKRKDKSVEENNLEPSRPQEVAVTLVNKDQLKFDQASRLGKFVGEVQKRYREDVKSPYLKIRQRGVALFLIDNFAFRIGYPKKKGDTSESAGCCLLKKKHVKCGKQYSVEFDFLGKDSIPYNRIVKIEKIFFKNLKIFLKGKTDEDYVFNLINADYINSCLKEVMVGLTAKVFRTHHASKMMQKQLTELTLASYDGSEKIRCFKEANEKVGMFLNHKLQVEQKGTIKEEHGRNFKTAVETSLESYIDPRITVAWCNKWCIPLEKVYSQCLIQKFKWAMSVKEEFVF